MPLSSRTRPFRKSLCDVPCPRYGMISNGSSSPNRCFKLNLNSSKRFSMACTPTAILGLHPIKITGRGLSSKDDRGSPAHLLSVAEYVTKSVKRKPLDNRRFARLQFESESSPHLPGMKH